MSLRTEIERLWDDVGRLSDESAFQKAGAALADQSRFKCVPSTGGAVDPRLPPLLGRLGSVVRALRAVRGEAEIDLDQVRESDYHKGYYRIGSDADFTELAFRSGDDRIFQLDASTKVEHVRTFPSILHWIVFTDVLLNEDSMQLGE